MGRLYESMFRMQNPLSPAVALREASRWLRGWKDAEGQPRYATPRYWAAFVCHERR